VAKRPLGRRYSRLPNFLAAKGLSHPGTGQRRAPGVELGLQWCRPSRRTGSSVSLRIPSLFLRSTGEGASRALSNQESGRLRADARFPFPQFLELSRPVNEQGKTGR